MMEQAGESTILQNYMSKLLRLAERNLSPQLRRKVDEDDISATVFRTVIRQAREGIITIEESLDFWKLLQAITLNKIRKKARYWKAQKRSMSREIELAADGPRLEELAIDPVNEEGDPTEEEGNAFLEVVETLNGQLDEACQRVLAMKMEGLTHLQIAEQLDVSTRTVTRYVTKIQEMLLAIQRETEA